MKETNKSNLLLQKKWYSINDTIKRLNKISDTLLTEADVFSFVRDKNISLYLYSKSYYGERCVEEKDGTFKYEGLCRLKHPVKLELEKCPELESYIFELANEGTVYDEYDYASPKSPDFQILVSDESRELYRVLHGSSPEILFNKLTENMTKEDRDGFVPVSFFPVNNQLGFTSGELDQFEKSNMRDEIEIPKKTDKRVINSLLKLVFGMAVSKYEYNPEAKRSDTVKRIESDLNLHDVELHDDAIRSSLEAATAYIQEIRTKKP